MVQSECSEKIHKVIDVTNCDILIFGMENSIQNPVSFMTSEFLHQSLHILHH